jgi:hypothetical protein
MSGQEQLQRQYPCPKDYDEYMTWRIRWYLIIAITIAYMLLLASGLIGFWITKDIHYLLFFIPTSLIPFVRYLVPMDKKRYDLKLAGINAKKELHATKAQAQMLEVELRRQQERLLTK